MESPWRGRRGRQVRGSGPAAAPILFLGEAPGKDEEWAGEPFVGAAGRFLWHGQDWRGTTRFEGLERMGVRREDCRIENVVETRPQDNVLATVTPENVRRWQGEFWARLEGLAPNVIVPLGNLALNTLRRSPLPLTKKGKWRIKRQQNQPPQIDWRDKIGNWRGSVFGVHTNNGRRIKVIPTFHPAYVLRAGDFYGCWRGDLERIRGDARFPELRLDPRSSHLIDPTPEDGHAFEVLVHQTWLRDGREAILAADIETIAKGRRIDCIGLSVDETFSITLDLRFPWAWALLRRLMKHPIAKTFHFGVFDVFKLAEKGVPVRNWRWDSLNLHHTLDPRDQHRLAYCASRDLRVRYWKDERKEEGKSASAKEARNRPRFHKYCGKDVCRTHALTTRYIAKVRARGLLRVYRQLSHRTALSCLRLAQTGFNVDHAVRAEIAERERLVIAETRQAMTAMAERDLVAEKGLSNPRVAAYFFDRLGCKAERGSRSTNELVLRRLWRRYKKARPMVELILRYREKGKVAQEVRATIVSSDGRLRSRYSPTAKTLRLRAGKISDDEGINAQNRDRKSDLRRMFIPDSGHVLIEVDQSQGESRIVDGMGGNVGNARVSPLERDLHVENAAKIFDVEYDDLLAAYRAGDPDADLKRQLGKRTRHAANYGMGGVRMSEQALVDTEGALVLDPDECDDWLERMKKRAPEIEAYQAWIRGQLIETGSLTSSWGMTVYFTGLRLTQEHHKEAYAWMAQHEVGTLTNQGGLNPLDEELQDGRWRGAKAVQQGHDSVVVSAPPRHAYAILRFLAERMGVARTYPGVNEPWTLAMPIGVKAGPNWKDMTEWKLLPTEKEFDQWLSEYSCSSPSRTPSRASRRTRSSSPSGGHAIRA